MIDRATVSEAVRRTLAEATGRPCGLGKLPLVEGQPAEKPYLVQDGRPGTAAGLERTATGGWRRPIDVPGVDVWARELKADAGVDDADSAAGVVSYPQRFCLYASE